MVQDWQHRANRINKRQIGLSEKGKTMRSSEFLNEAGRDGTPMTDAEFAAQQAQGAKNLDSIRALVEKLPAHLVVEPRQQHRILMQPQQEPVSHQAN